MVAVLPVPDKDPRRQLGELIQRARVELGLSHRDVGDSCGATADRVRAWEAGEDAPRGRQWPRLKGSLRRLIAAQAVWQAALKMTAAESDLDEDAEAREADVVERAEITPRYVQAVVEPPGFVATEPPPALPDPTKATTFGRALAQARVNDGLTQREVADLIGVAGQQVLSSWERDMAVPIRDHYEKLCQVFTVLSFCVVPPSRDIPKPVGMAGSGQSNKPTGISAFPKAPPVAGHRVDRVPVERPAVIAIAAPPMTKPANPSLDPLESAGIQWARAKRDVAEARLEVERVELLLKEKRQDLLDAEARLKTATARVDELIKSS